MLNNLNRNKKSLECYILFKFSGKIFHSFIICQVYLFYYYTIKLKSLSSLFEMYALMVSMKIKAQNLKTAVNWIEFLTSLSDRFNFHVLDLDYTCRYEVKKMNHPPECTSSQCTKSQPKSSPALKRQIWYIINHFSPLCNYLQFYSSYQISYTNWEDI